MIDETRLHKILKQIRVLVIICLQFGDTGKGKIVELLLSTGLFDAVVRGNGGANSGRTSIVNGRRVVMHQLPSGVLHDDRCASILGPGVAFDPFLMKGELDELFAIGGTANHLTISHRASVVTPLHLLLDRLPTGEDDVRIGTTGRGIGYAYADHLARVGLVANDLLNVDVLAAKLRAQLAFHQPRIQSVMPSIVSEILNHRDLNSGAYFSASKLVEVDAMIEAYRKLGADLYTDMITDTETQVQNLIARNEPILVEGANGFMLGVDTGTYPFVTSSNTNAWDVARGAGIHRDQVSEVWGLIKGLFMTRVGEGPFPTEFGGAQSSAWCNKTGASRQQELDWVTNHGYHLNSQDEFKRSVALRQIADEYGATTGRPRRCGRADLPMLRAATAHVPKARLILTKLDSLMGMDTIQVCTHYIYRGSNYRHGGDTIRTGDKVAVAIPDPQFLRHCEPQYVVLPGWHEPIGSCTNFFDLPETIRRAVTNLEHGHTNGWHVNRQSIMVSVGAERDQTILV